MQCQCCDAVLWQCAREKGKCFIMLFGVHLSVVAPIRTTASEMFAGVCVCVCVCVCAITWENTTRVKLSLIRSAKRGEWMARTNETV